MPVFEEFFCLLDDIFGVSLFHSFESFSTLALADDFTREFEWLHVSSSLQGSTKYSGRT